MSRPNFISLLLKKNNVLLVQCITIRYAADQREEGRAWLHQGGSILMPR
jgi:hypothetical protein